MGDIVVNVLERLKQDQEQCEKAAASSNGASSKPPLNRFTPDKALAFAEKTRLAATQPAPRIRVPWPSIAAHWAGEASGAASKRSGITAGSHILIGNSGAGKTQFALSIALEAVKNQTPVLYLALEMNEDSVIARMTALEAKTSWSDLDLSRRAPTSAEVAALGEISTGFLFVEECTPMAFSAVDLREKTEALRKEYPEGIALVVVDYLQLIGGEKDLRERIGSVAYAARDLARKHNLAFLLISSTARTFYGLLDGDDASSDSKRKPEPMGKGDPSRFIGLGKESGEIEFSADTVVVLGKERSQPLVHVAFAKVRHGNRPWGKLLFDGLRFTEPTDEDINHYEAEKESAAKAAVLEEKKKKPAANGISPDVAVSKLYEA